MLRIISKLILDIIDKSLKVTKIIFKKSCKRLNTNKQQLN